MEVQSFLGFMGYYCRFIPKFVQVASPLRELTSGENVGKKKAVIKWDSRCQQAFDDLKNSVPWHPFLYMPILLSHSSFILMLVALVWGLFSIKLGRMAPKQ